MKSETKEKILKSSRELFFRYGIKRVTMDDLSKHLGMSKKTLYQAYYDKDTLVVELTEFILHEHMAKFNGIHESTRDALHELLTNMEYMGAIFREMSPSMYYDMQKYYQPSWNKFHEFKNTVIIGILERNMKRGIAEGLYRKNIDIKVISRLRVEEIEMAMNASVFPSDKFNVGEVQLKLLDHFMHGIVTLKGHKLINKYKQIQEEE